MNIVLTEDQEKLLDLILSDEPLPVELNPFEMLPALRIWHDKYNRSIDVHTAGVICAYQKLTSEVWSLALSGKKMGVLLPDQADLLVRRFVVESGSSDISENNLREFSIGLNGLKGKLSDNEIKSLLAVFLLGTCTGDVKNLV